MARGSILALAAIAAAGASSAFAHTAALPTATQPPAIFPTPRSEQLRAGTVAVPPSVTLVTGSSADSSALRVVRDALRTAGAREIRDADAAPRGSFAVVVEQGGAAKGLKPGGYTLAIGNGRIVLDGVDAAGEFYAAQTLSQVVARAQGRALPALAIRDWPSLPFRGIVEGFYGHPWTDAARESQLDFLGAHKLNVDIYSPKDDPYLRASWRAPNPPKLLATFRKLAARAAGNHVTLTYALSPGLSVCYSSAADVAAAIAKFQSLWDVGVRSFAVALDDVAYTTWNCSEDETAFGTGPVAAATAQALFLNAIQRGFVATHAGAGRLVLVPTEYSGVSSSPYKQTLAQQLDPKIVVMWTGNSTYAPFIHTDEAAAAREAYGHDVLVWDNFPVVRRASPLRLELGAYVHRDPSLPSAIVGVASNPMAFANASRIALFTVADYAWNTTAYDPGRSWAGSVADLAGGDPATTSALRTFADVNYASSVDPRQAPLLSARIAAFWRAWKEQRPDAADGLRPALLELAAAPGVLRSRLRNPRFLTETAPWLSATQAWGRAAVEALDALVARRAGSAASAREHRLAALGQADLAGSFFSLDESSTVRVDVGIGVLDTFVDAALAAPG